MSCCWGDKLYANVLRDYKAPVTIEASADIPILKAHNRYLSLDCPLNGRIQRLLRAKRRASIVRLLRKS